MDEPVAGNDPAALREAAGIINIQRQIIQSFMDSVYSDARALAQYWEGGGADRYFDRLKKCGDPQNAAAPAGKIVKILEEYADGLNQAADGYAAAAGRAENLTGALPSGVFTV